MINIPFLKNKKDSDFFLAIFLKEEKGNVILLKKDSNLISIKDKADFFYTNGWENLTEDVDTALYQLEKRNPEAILSKTIFFVYSHFIDEVTGNIKNPYLSKIKLLVKNLELEPLGYIDCIEGISAYLEKKEQNPLTATIVELDKNQLGVFVYQGGRQIYKKNISRTDHLINDFVLAIDDLNNKKILLPSRLIIYHSQDSDKQIDQLINHRFEKKYFAQIPKIEILNEQEVMQSLIDIFSKQIIVVNEPKEEKINQSFGFVVGEDISQIEEKLEKTKEKFNFNFPSPKLPKIVLPKIKFNWDFIKSKYIFFIGLFLIVFALFLNEYFLHKANLKIYLPAKNIEKQTAKNIDYKIATVSADFSETVDTVGKKEVGEKAKGSVVIHNFDDKEVTFNKGTVITANNLKFLLESDVKVASATLIPDGSAKLPGKKEVSIIAENIGSEYNLAKGKRFKIDNFSESLYFGINESAFANGSKKQIRTVSTADVENLEKLVIEKAKKKNEKPTLAKDETFIPELTEVEITEKKYSKEIGEEADKLTLKAKVNTSYYLYNQNQLKESLIKDIEKDLDSDFSVDKDKISFKIKKVSQEGKQIKLDLDIKGKAIKKIDKEKIYQKILFKNKNNLEKILKDNFQVSGFSLNIDQPLPLLKNFLPLFKKNIFVEFSSL